MKRKKIELLRWSFKAFGIALIVGLIWSALTEHDFAGTMVMLFYAFVILIFIMTS